MAQGYKHEEMTFADLCKHIYTAFGAYAVINLVNDRQQEGYLSDVTWKDCDGCDYRSPFDTDGSCLICGEWKPKKIASSYGCGAYNCLVCYPYQYACDNCSERFSTPIENGAQYDCEHCEYESFPREDEDSCTS